MDKKLRNRELTVLISDSKKRIAKSAKIIESVSAITTTMHNVEIKKLKEEIEYLESYIDEYCKL